MQPSTVPPRHRGGSPSADLSTSVLHTPILDLGPIAARAMRMRLDLAIVPQPVVELAITRECSPEFLGAHPPPRLMRAQDDGVVEHMLKRSTRRITFLSLTVAFGGKGTLTCWADRFHSSGGRRLPSCCSLNRVRRRCWAATKGHRMYLPPEQHAVLPASAAVTAVTGYSSSSPLFFGRPIARHGLY